MGVHGLWKLLEPAGKAVALESLQNKILGVDVSIWLHQAMKGFQDRKGSPLPNAHLLGIFHRVCKLLFYRIKPVFVFDGGVPVLKKSTIAARRKFKGRAAQDAARVAEQLLKNLVKHKAVRKVLGEKAGRHTVSEDRPRNDENLFELPPMLNDLNEHVELSSDSEVSVKYEPSGEESDSEQEVKYLSPSKVYAMNLDLHTLDVKSENFRSLPADVRHDILSDLKETRKQSSWGRLHEMPKESTDFSSFQLNRLLKRRNVQVSLEEAEKEMGGKVLSMAELEDIMSAQGVKVEDGIANSKEAQLNAYSKRIASDVATRFLLVSESANNKDPPSETPTDATKELKKEEKLFDKDIKIKQEYEDDWSSDEGPVSVKKVSDGEKFAEGTVKIKIEDTSRDREETWSSEDDIERFKKDENLAEQFVNEKDLSQAEILAMIQNENKQAKHSSHRADIPSTSKAADEAFDSILVEDKASTSKPEVKTPITRKTDLITPRKGQVRDGSPVTARSDSDNDFDEVLPAESEIIENVVKAKPVENKNIEVVINKNQSYKLEDDIFADIFPVGEEPKEIIQVSPERVAKQPEKSKEIIEDSVVNLENETAKIPEKSGEDLKIGENKVDNLPVKEIDKAQKDVQETVQITSIVDKHIREPDAGNVTTDKADSEMKEYDEREIEEDDEKKSDQKEMSEKPSAGLDVPPMSSEELKTLESALEEKHEELLAEKGRQERIAASITDQMCAEAQELLRLFGVPYIVAPMEAEAQCAFLDSLCLTEGTITDDSDIWLFGGRKVYKNFFNQKKHVLQYTSTTIQHYLKLERLHMVLLALLVGSDYTTGLQGIGPVTAMEVLAAFPPGKGENLPENRAAMLEGLRRFRDWWQAGRPHRSPATQQLRNKVKDVQFYEGFPSLAVVDAYLRPAVDESREVFSWGDIDLEGLREFARMKFGWAQAKADEILLPVAKKVAERKNQRFIDSYFNLMPQYNEGEKKMSKRVKKAVRRMDNQNGSDSDEEDDPKPKRPNPTQRRVAQDGGKPNRRRARQHKEDEDAEEDRESVRREAQQRKRVSGPRKRAAKRAVAQAGDSAEEDDPQPVSQDLPEDETASDDELQNPKQNNISGSRKATNKRAAENELNEKESDEEDDIPSVPKKSKVTRTVVRQKQPKNNEQVERTRAKQNEGPKPHPRQRTSTGVIRTGAKVPRTDTDNDNSESNNEEVTKKASQPRKKVTNTHGAKSGSTSLKTIPEDTSLPGPSTSRMLEPVPGTSKGTNQDDANDMDPDEEEEAILATLHALDWDDDPWGGFEPPPPREKLFFGGVRKNPTKPRRPPPPEPLPAVPASPARPVDTRGYRPGSLTLDRIESRVTHPQLEWKSPSSNIPQKEMDRQQAEESKMKAIKLFKAAGAKKTTKLLGEDPENAKRRVRKKKPVAKVGNLNLSEESSDD